MLDNANFALTALPPATSGLLRPLRRALELRYQVYCVECSFLSPADYPDGLETDAHDDDAAHFHAFDADHELVGYVRLVQADEEQRFPLQRHCGDFFTDMALPPAREAAEISRLMVRNEYRRLRGNRLEGVTPEQNSGLLSSTRRLEATQVLLCLYKQMYLHSLDNGIRYWYAAMERPLARSLAQSGFAFQQIGPATDYYGPVAPYLADLRELEAGVGRARPDMLAWMQSPLRTLPPTIAGAYLS